MKVRTTFFGVLVIVGLLTATAANTRAEPRSYPITGTYRYVGGDAETRAIEDAIDEAVDDMNVFIRGIARRRLREPNLPAERISIVATADEATVAPEDRPKVTAPVGKTPVEWTNPNNGNTLRVSYRVPTPRRLEQRLRGDRGLSVLSFDLQEDGSTLTITTRITADLLSKPLEFRTTYRRDESRP